MKDLAACEKLRGGGKQPLIRRYPNGETQFRFAGLSYIEYIDIWKCTWGTETSKYPEENKEITFDVLTDRYS